MRLRFLSNITFKLLSFTCCLLLSSNFLLAKDAVVSIGLVEPRDGIITDIYEVAPSYSLRLIFTKTPTFSWLLGLRHDQLSSEIVDASSRINLTMFDLGFQQSFPIAPSEATVFTFFGAGISLVHSDQRTDTPTTRPIEKSENTIGAYWEVGIDFALNQRRNAWFEIRLEDRLVRKNIVAETNLGSQTLYFGYRHRW